MPTVALDGRGAERGPETIVAGARAAAADGIRVRVFGDPASLAAVERIDGAELVSAAEEITNLEEPVAAVRSRPQASVVLAARDVAEGRSQAIASAGSTGATMTAALFALRRMQGVRRPALALQLLVPARPGQPTLLLDVGANADARAQDLVQFAYLGAAFSEAVLGVARPRVALLSVGEEATKGSAEVVEAHARLAGAEGLDFRGNLEGKDLLAGMAEVIVTDGFTGNVVLKTIEGTARTVAEAVRAAARSGPVAAAGGLLLRPLARRPAPPARPRHDGRRDPARPARRRRGWTRQLGARGHRQRGAAGGARGRSGRRRAYGQAAGRGRHDPRRVARRAAAGRDA